MFRWLPYTFVRITLFFVAGILFAIYYDGNIPYAIARMFLVTLTCGYVAIAFAQRMVLKQFLFTGFVIAATLFLSGYLLVNVRTAANDEDHFMVDLDSITYYRATVVGQPEKKDRSWRMEVEVDAILAHGWSKASGNIIVYYSRSDSTRRFQFGDVILVKGKPTEVKGPANPGEFDYRRFLFFRNIYHQHFLRNGGIRLLKNEASGPMAYAIPARIWADGILRNVVDGERAQAIVTALVLGVSGGLDQELLNAYATTGTTHILSVSGLHVSIIYMLLLLGLKPLAKTVSGKWLLALISIVVLWGYAFITGLSPSVLRAVTMFTCMALARPWKRSASIYNTLAVSAFVLLCYDPFLIMSVGFQLSYLAVLGIVYLHPRIYERWAFKNWIGDECWKMTSVSIAAQIATLPLTLFYFHQFPTYFLLANLLVIPGSSAVLILGISAIIFAIIPAVSGAMGWVAAFIVDVMNKIVFIMETFPGSRIDNIFLTPLQAWSLAAMIVFALGLFHFRKFSFAIATFSAVLVFTISQWSHVIRQIEVEKIVVYSVPGHSAMDLIDHGTAISFLDSALRHSAQAIRYQVEPCRVASGVQRVVSEEKIIKALPGCKLIRWRGMTILNIVNPHFRMPRNIQCDLVVVSNNAIPCSQAITRITSAPVILDSSNSFYFAETFLEQAGADSIPVYSVRHQGAFVSLR